MDEENQVLEADIYAGIDSSCVWNRLPVFFIVLLLNEVFVSAKDVAWDN